MFYSPIFGICFQLPIICAEERIHINHENEPGKRSGIIALDSDAEHQSEKSEHPV
jgi:hypothetical protein